MEGSSANVFDAANDKDPIAEPEEDSSFVLSHPLPAPVEPTSSLGRLLAGESPAATDNAPTNHSIPPTELSASTPAEPELKLLAETPEPIGNLIHDEMSLPAIEPSLDQNKSNESEAITTDVGSDNRVTLSAPSTSGIPILFWFLLAWASMATTVAFWLWWYWPSPAPALDNLPDDGMMPARIVSPIEPISPQQIVRLGETKRIGDLEIHPLAIEERPVRIMPGEQSTGKTLVLSLELKNVGQLPIRATDPAFFYPDPKRRLKGLPAFDRSGYTYTYIQPAHTLEGLILPFDLPTGMNLKIEGQDFPILQPGEKTQTIVISEEDSAGRLADESIWRIKFRKTKTPTGRALATVVGVAFSKNEVKRGS